ncbi:MAG: hypothetical protein ACRCYU_19125, partial [Nocardioides sp.]
MVSALYGSATDDGYSYRVRLWCAFPGGEENIQCMGATTECGPPTGSLVYEILRQPATNPNTAWETVGRTCLTPDDLTNLGQITPELVTTAFKKLTWPPADL